MLHMKCKSHGCSSLREQVIYMDLNVRVDVNCGRKDGRTDRRKTGRLYCTLLKQVRQKLTTRD